MTNGDLKYENWLGTPVVTFKGTKGALNYSTLLYITLHYTHYITLLENMTYIFEISANNAIK